MRAERVCIGVYKITKKTALNGMLLLAVCLFTSSCGLSDQQVDSRTGVNDQTAGTGDSAKNNKRKPRNFQSPAPSGEEGNEGDQPDGVLQILGGMYLTGADGSSPPASSHNLTAADVEYFGEQSQELPSLKDATSVRLWFKLLRADPAADAPSNIRAYIIADVPPSNNLNDATLSSRGVELDLKLTPHPEQSTSEQYYQASLPVSQFLSGSQPEGPALALTNSSNDQNASKMQSLLIQSMEEYFQYFGLVTQATSTEPTSTTSDEPPLAAEQCKVPPQTFSGLGYNRQCDDTSYSAAKVATGLDAHNKDNNIYSVFLLYDPTALATELQALIDSGSKISMRPGATDLRVVDPEDAESLCSNHVLYKNINFSGNVAGLEIASAQGKLPNTLRCDYICRSCQDPASGNSAGMDLALIGFEHEACKSHDCQARPSMTVTVSGYTDAIKTNKQEIVSIGSRCIQYDETESTYSSTGWTALNGEYKGHIVDMNGVPVEDEAQLNEIMEAVRTNDIDTLKKYYTYQWQVEFPHVPVTTSETSWTKTRHEKQINGQLHSDGTWTSFPFPFDWNDSADLTFLYEPHEPIFTERNETIRLGFLDPLSTLPRDPDLHYKSDSASFYSQLEIRVRAPLYECGENKFLEKVAISTPSPADKIEVLTGEITSRLNPTCMGRFEQTWEGGQHSEIEVRVSL